MSRTKEQRKWLKSMFSESESFNSDQMDGKPQPPLSIFVVNPENVIALPEFGDDIFVKTHILDIINDRVSHRKFKDESITLEELSFLLWSTQGVKSVAGDQYATMRTVPSAGARHPYETNLMINKVDGLKKGIYRYLPLIHQLEYVYTPDNMDRTMTQAARKQKFAGNCSVALVWSVVPYRGEWRYNERSHKPMLLDVGHICQNLYLACEAIGCGTCAIAAYDQKLLDELLQLDGDDEFAVYLAPVGKV
ncbi:MAG: SagB-type dehydrogenase domain [Clostridiales bacterium 38_11]|nr:MAG: SagB-type dehydrogenase domain [Clostridiales bacterium 38_11]HBH13533.1 nitroreductase [Clostridiales bacterium]